MAHKRLGLGLAGSVAAIALMAFTAPAGAQNISALKAQIDALQKKVDALDKQTAGKVVHRGRKRIELTVSGQVNRAIRYANDGTNDQIQHVDNDNSGTRVRWVGKGRLNEDISAGTVIEFNVTTAQSTTLSLQENQNVSSGDGIKLRKQDIYFDSKRMGRLWVGRGDPASNGTSEIDLSGLESPRLGGSIHFMMGGVCYQEGSGVAVQPGPADPGAAPKDKGQCVSSSNPSIGTAWSSFDGISRDDRIRYDTPKFAGFKLGVSHVTGDDWDVALKFNAKLGAAEVKAGAAYVAPNTSTTASNQYNGSGSVLFPMGLALTIQGGLQEQETEASDDRWDIFGRIGYQFKGTDLGKTYTGFDIGYAENIAAQGDETTSYAILISQDIDKMGTEIYAVAEVWDLDRPGSDFDKIWGISAGARIKF